MSKSKWQIQMNRKQKGGRSKQGEGDNAKELQSKTFSKQLEEGLTKKPLHQVMQHCRKMRKEIEGRKASRTNLHGCST